MIAMNRTTLMLALFGILAFPVTAPSVQRSNAPVGSRIVDGIELTIASEEAFLSGEPVRLRLALRNCTPKAIDLADTGPVTSFVLEVLNDRGSPVDLTEQGKGIEEMRRHGSNFGLEIPPGETVVHEVELSRWFDLSLPGLYTVRATRRLFSPGCDDPVRLVSNDLTIAVAQ